MKHSEIISKVKAAIGNNVNISKITKNQISGNNYAVFKFNSAEERDKARELAQSVCVCPLRNSQPRYGIGFMVSSVSLGE